MAITTITLGRSLKPDTIKLSSLAKVGEPQFLELEHRPCSNFISVKIDDKEVIIQAEKLLKAIATLTD